MLRSLSQPVHHVELFPWVAICLKFELHVVCPGPLSRHEGHMQVLFLLHGLLGHLLLVELLLLSLNQA